MAAVTDIKKWFPSIGVEMADVAMSDPSHEDYPGFPNAGEWAASYGIFVYFDTVLLHLYP